MKTQLCGFCGYTINTGFTASKTFKQAAPEDKVAICCRCGAPHRFLADGETLQVMSSDEVLALNPAKIAQILDASLTVALASLEFQAEHPGKQWAPDGAGHA